MQFMLRFGLGVHVFLMSDAFLSWGLKGVGTNPPSRTIHSLVFLVCHFVVLLQTANIPPTW